MKVEIDHIGIVIDDLAPVLRFYGEALGLVAGNSEDVTAQRVRVSFLDAGGARLELLQATSADSPIARHLSVRGQGLHHIAFRVEDIRAAIQHLKAKGIRLVDDEPRPGAEGSLVAFVHPSSAHGVLIELKQPAGMTGAEGPKAEKRETAG